VSTQDYRINAEARRLLVSRWVDVSVLQIGTTNGVVYLLGNFEPVVEDALQRAGYPPEPNPVQRLLRLVGLVEKELRRIPGVRDIVFNLRNIRKKGGTWSVMGARVDGVLHPDSQRTQQRRAQQAPVQKPAEGPNDDEPSDPTGRAA